MENVIGQIGNGSLGVTVAIDGRGYVYLAFGEAGPEREVYVYEPEAAAKLAHLIFGASRQATAVRSSGRG